MSATTFRTTVFKAEHLETGEVIEMPAAQVFAIVREALVHYPECRCMSDRKIATLAYKNIAALEDGTSPDISFGDFTFTLSK